jgi:hypothetical protein
VAGGQARLGQRDHGCVVCKALVVACAVHGIGPREVIGVDIGEVEPSIF